jgi:hypothetical protein
MMPNIETWKVVSTYGDPTIRILREDNSLVCRLDDLDAEYIDELLDLAKLICVAPKMKAALELSVRMFEVNGLDTELPHTFEVMKEALK